MDFMYLKREFIMLNIFLCVTKLNKRFIVDAIFGSVSLASELHTLRLLSYILSGAIIFARFYCNPYVVIEKTTLLSSPIVAARAPFPELPIQLPKLNYPDGLSALPVIGITKIPQQLQCSFDFLAFRTFLTIPGDKLASSTPIRLHQVASHLYVSTAGLFRLQVYLLGVGKIIASYKRFPLR